jgi:Carboxypeptidase regulatory-like domain
VLLAESQEPLYTSYTYCIAVGALLFASSALFGQVIDGTVVDSITGLPIGGASIQIANAGKIPYQTLSDAQGAFRIEGVADGTYIAIVLKTGFQTPADATALRHFRVGAGLEPIHLQLSLIPLGKLSGRVFDANDRPVAGAEVNLLQGIGIGQTVRSNPDGGFSFDAIRPGSYALSARPPNDLKPPAPAADQRYAWVKTWFPGATDVSAADKILIRPGAEVVGQDIKLRAVNAYSIRGVARESNGDPAPKLTVKLARADDYQQSLDRTTVSGKDGSFEFADVYDGDWRLASEQSGEVILRTFAAVSVTGRDAEGIELRLTEPFSVPVEFLLQIQDSTTKIQGSVVLAPEWGGQSPVSSSDKDGTYKIEGLYPGHYLVNPLPLAGAGYYLASMTLGDRDVLGQMVEFSSGSVPLRVVYRSDGGTIRGIVEDCGNATIAIAPEDPALQRSRAFAPESRCNADGHFEIRSLRPGRYYAFAFDQLNENASDFLSSLPGLINQAVSVEVKAKETTNVELKVIAGPNP